MNHQSNTKIVDPFLLKILYQHRGQAEFTDILRSIQDEQNEIVDFDMRSNTVTQGCAGSGKTMILFHRLANILYNIDVFEGKVQANRIAIILPNDNFREYIRELTWSLGIEKIQTFTMNEYLLSKIVDVLMNIFKDESSDTISSGQEMSDKNKAKYQLLSQFRKNLSSDLSDAREISFTPKKAEKLSNFIDDYQNKHRSMVINRQREQEIRVERKKPGHDPEHAKWVNKSRDDIRKYRKQSMSLFVDEFLDGKLTRDYMLALLNAICDSENLASYRPAKDDIVMIDEGQDYGFIEYRTLKAINPDCIFNIYGDIDQKIFDRGIDGWSRIIDLFNANFFELNKDYRNSTEIVDFVNKKLNKSIFSVGYNTKDVESVNIKKLPVYLEYESKLLKHNIAIVSENPEEYRRFEDNLKVFSVKEIKGLEFDTIFISPEISQYSNNYKYVAYTRALSHLYILNNDES